MKLKNSAYLWISSRAALLGHLEKTCHIAQKKKMTSDTHNTLIDNHIKKNIEKTKCPTQNKPKYITFIRHNSSTNKITSIFKKKNYHVANKTINTLKKTFIHTIIQTKNMTGQMYIN